MSSFIASFSHFQDHNGWSLFFCRHLMGPNTKSTPEGKSAHPDATLLSRLTVEVCFVPEFRSVSILLHPCFRCLFLPHIYNFTVFIILAAAGSPRRPHAPARGPQRSPAVPNTGLCGFGGTPPPLHWVSLSGLPHPLLREFRAYTFPTKLENPGFIFVSRTSGAFFSSGSVLLPTHRLLRACHLEPTRPLFGSSHHAAF